MLNFLAVNWTNISSNWIDWALTGYRNIFGDWVYPIMFLGIIGYVYAVNRSALSAAAAICIIFVVFGATGIFTAENMYFALEAWIIVIVAFAALFVTLIIDKKRG